jgi:mono/diheme cytochrome c family protein
MMKRLILTSGTLGLAVLLTGCNPSQVERAKETQPAPPTKPAAENKKPTFSELVVPPKPSVTAEFIAQGKKVYAQNCAACHGVNGDGKADAAAFLAPKPRNFAQANYRLRSTPSGSLPTDEDLFRAVSLGSPGTPMPPWQVHLSEEDRWAVVEYIKTFSARFADTNENRKITVALGTPPTRHASAIAEGKALYTKFACVTCHGETGRGDGTAAVGLVDDSGLKTKARNFTQASSFKSGHSAKEMVRTILTGFNGTPMLGFDGVVSKEEAWKIAYYIETLAKAPPSLVARSSQNFLERETLGEPDVRIKVTERAWKFDPAVLRVKKGQIVEITFEPTDNGLGVGHGFAISSYDEVAFINGAMVGMPKTIKFRADHAGQFTIYCSTQCSTEKLHPLMNGKFIVEDSTPIKTASAQ